MYKGKIWQIFDALLVFSYQVSRVEVNGRFGLLKKPTLDVRGKSWTGVLLFTGGLIYLLDLFCNGTNPTVRERSAELFSKMMSDKLIGPKVKILLAKFLPAIFMDAMRDSAEASVHMFEGKSPFYLS